MPPCKQAIAESVHWFKIRSSLCLHSIQVHVVNLRKGLLETG